LVLLVVSFVQHRMRAAEASGMSPPSDLGELLLGFFRLYGVDFNYSLTGISVRDGGSYFPKASRRGWVDPQRPYLLCVEDPDDPTNDVGRNSFDIMNVRALFQVAHEMLASRAAVHGLGRPPSLLSLILTVHPQIIAYRAWTRAQYRSPELDFQLIQQQVQRTGEGCGQQQQQQQQQSTTTTYPNGKRRYVKSRSNFHRGPFQQYNHQQQQQQQQQQLPPSQPPPSQQQPQWQWPRTKSP
jgi:DNA polymerase sigma